jgi:hypothetical protein
MRTTRFARHVGGNRPRGEGGAGEPEGGERRQRGVTLLGRRRSDFIIVLIFFACLSTDEFALLPIPARPLFDVRRLAAYEVRSDRESLRSWGRGKLRACGRISFAITSRCAFPHGPFDFRTASEFRRRSAIAQISTNPTKDNAGARSPFQTRARTNVAVLRSVARAFSPFPVVGFQFAPSRSDRIRFPSLTSFTVAFPSLSILLH